MNDASDAKIASDEKKKNFSDWYESSDIDSDTSFGPEKVARREEEREAARAKWNYDQILRFEHFFPDLHQPENKETDVLKEKVKFLCSVVMKLLICYYILN